jgi:hypothetical protein
VNLQKLEGGSSLNVNLRKLEGGSSLNVNLRKLDGGSSLNVNLRKLEGGSSLNRTGLSSRFVRPRTVLGCYTAGRPVRAGLPE